MHDVADQCNRPGPDSYHPNNVISIMQEIGYRTWAIESTGIHECNEITEETVATNFLFTFPGKHDMLVQQLACL